MRNLARALLVALPMTALAGTEAPPPQLRVPDLPSTYELFSPGSPVLGVLPKGAPAPRIYVPGRREPVTVLEDPRLLRSMPTCFYATCPAVTCADAVVPPGECCPRCPSGRPGGPVGGNRAEPAR